MIAYYFYRGLDGQRERADAGVYILSETPYGILHRAEDGKLISLHPWSIILEVFYE